MAPKDDPRFQVASHLSVGAREYQEDALSVNFAEGADLGIAVLSDGMGGHAAGDVASRIVVETVSQALAKESSDLANFSHNIHSILQNAARSANEKVREHAEANPETRGMGATLVATVILHNLMYWVSIGDSPLYLYRNGRLQQLNEDHSMAPQIDFLVRSGLMDAEMAKNHPDRSVLLSVIIGKEIEKMDCPTDPFRLEPGDLIIVSSDGVQYLEDHQIEAVLASCEGQDAEEITKALDAALDDLDDPQQDNSGIAAIRFFGGEGDEEETFELIWEEEIEPPAANADEPTETLKTNGGAG